MKTTKSTNRMIAFIMLILSLIFISPLYVALVNAFKSYDEIIKHPLSPPFKFTLDNLKDAFHTAHIAQLYYTSALITVISVILIIFFTSMAAYVLAKRNNKLYKFLYLFFLIGIMVPGQLVVIPSLKTLQFFHLLHTLPGLYLFYVGGYMSMGTFLYVEYIKTIPDSIEESGIMDGANTFTIFFKLIFPLIKPCTATATIFFGLWIWNDFLPPMYILGSNNGRTITTGIYSAIGSHTTDWNIVFACVLFASLPVVAVYLLLQKQFMKGLTTGAVKG
jgi:raffinose/stachyose/melibiose transport system permease protein